jgi:hypothetical protein
MMPTGEGRDSLMAAGLFQVGGLGSVGAGCAAGRAHPRENDTMENAGTPGFTTQGTPATAWTWPS